MLKVDDRNYVLNGVLDTLIEENLRMQMSHALQRFKGGFKRDEMVNGLAYSKEFCTIKLCTHRQAGHTTALVTNAIKYCENCLILCENQRMLDFTRQTFLKIADITPDINIDSSSKDNVVLIQLGKRRIFHFKTFDCVTEKANFQRGLALDSVMVDVASFLSKEKMNCIYGLFTPCMMQSDERLFVFME